MLTALGVIMFLVGLVSLDRGADWIADSAAALARRTGAPLALIGLITVGIEWEELGVVVVALLTGAPQLAFGALIGSAIANLTLGLAAGLLARPLTLAPPDRMIAWIALGASVAVAALAWSGDLGRPSGILLLALFGGYVAWIGRQSRAGRATAALTDDDDNDVDIDTPFRHPALGIAAGLLLAIIGGELVVRGALRMAAGVGLSETVIGLTIVALGTSAPDAAISLAAARRGASALVLANTAGSNVCILLLLLGLVAVVQPVSVPSAILTFDLPVLLAVSALAIVLARRRLIRRGHGVALLAIYGLYLVTRIN